MSGPGEPPSCQDLNSACSFTSSSYLPPHNNPGPQPPWSQVKSKELGGHHPQIGWYPIPTQNESLPKITFPSGNVITATTLAVRSRPFPCVHPKDWSGGWADPSAFLFWLHTASLLVGSGHQDALSSHLCPAVLLQAFWDIEKQTWLHRRGAVWRQNKKLQSEWEPYFHQIVGTTDMGTGWWLKVVARTSSICMNILTNWFEDHSLCVCVTKCLWSGLK